MLRWEIKPGSWRRHWGVAVLSVLANDGLAERPSSGKGLSEVTLGDLGKGPQGRGQSQRTCPEAGLCLDHMGQRGSEGLA